MKQILIAEVRKQSKITGKFADSNWYRHSFTSFDRDKLKGVIERYYKVELVKDEENEFPYFTDGGFKYSGENDNWIFETEAHWYDII